MIYSSTYFCRRTRASWEIGRIITVSQDIDDCSSSSGIYALIQETLFKSAGIRYLFRHITMPRAYSARGWSWYGRSLNCRCQRGLFFRSSSVDDFLLDIIYSQHKIPDLRLKISKRKDVSWIYEGIVTKFTFSNSQDPDDKFAGNNNRQISGQYKARE